MTERIAITNFMFFRNFNSEDYHSIWFENCKAPGREMCLTCRELGVQLRGAAVRLDHVAGHELHVVVVAEGHADVEPAARAEHV